MESLHLASRDAALTPDGVDKALPRFNPPVIPLNVPAYTVLVAHWLGWPHMTQWKGRYWFEDKRSQELIPIPDAIFPQQRRITPRTTHHQPPPETESGAHQHRHDEGFDLQGSQREPQPARDRVGANSDPVRSNVPIRSRRQSQSTQEKSAVRTTSRPSATVVEFVQIRYNDFLECNRFIEQDPNVLSADPESFLDAAVQARRNQDDMLSLRCIQRYVIVNACRDLTAEARRNYLFFLGRRDPNDQHCQEYFSDFKKISDEVRRRFQGNSRPMQQNDMKPPISQSQSVDPADIRGYDHPLPTDCDASYVLYGRPIVSPTTYVPNSSAYAQPTAFPTAAPSRGLPSIEGFPKASASGIPTQAEAAIGQHMQPAPFAVSTSRTSASYQQETRIIDQQQGATKSRAFSRSSNSCDKYDYKHKLPTAGGIENVEFRGSDENQLAADSEQLDSRYILRNDGAAFFSEGRVFSLMYHESLGLKPGDPPVSNLDRQRVSIGPKGVLIHSKIRRMAVVRKRQGYSICVPINSYGGRGVGQKNMGPEVQAHAIAYPSRQDPPPGRLTGEPQFSKKPIAVDLNRGHDLGAASRIHFGKLQSIEWNVKVMDIGRIAQRSMADFEAYWRDEYFPPEKPRVDANTRR